MDLGGWLSHLYSPCTRSDCHSVQHARRLRSVIAHPITVRAISGSLRSGSLNSMLLRATAQLAPPEVSVALYRELGDRQSTTGHRKGQWWFQRIGVWHRVRSPSAVSLRGEAPSSPWTLHTNIWARDPALIFTTLRPCRGEAVEIR